MISFVSAVQGDAMAFNNILLRQQSGVFSCRKVFNSAKSVRQKIQITDSVLVFGKDKLIYADESQDYRYVSQSKSCLICHTKKKKVLKLWKKKFKTRNGKLNESQTHGALLMWYSRFVLTNSQLSSTKQYSRQW